ncbi:MAG: MFS transporter [Pseudomonadota bacterium]
MTLLRILLLWAAGLGAAGQFAKFSVFFPIIEATYPDAGAASGFLVSVISLMGVVFGLTAGLLSAHIGMRRLLVWALVLGGTLSMFQALFPPFSAMLALRILEGLSHLAIVVVAPTLILQVASDQWRGAAMTLWGTFFGVAFAIVALAGGALLEARGIEAVFGAHGLFMIICALSLHVGLRGVARVRPDGQLPGVGRLIVQHAAVYASARVAAPALGWLFYTFTFVAALTVLPGFIEEEARLFAVAAMPIASIVVSLTLGVLALRFMSAVTLIIVGFVLSIALVVVIAVAGVSALLLITLLGALGLVQGASFAAIGELVKTPTDRANASGALAQMGNLGNLIGTPVFLLAAQWNGVPGVALVMVIAYLGGMGVHALCAWRRASIDHDIA